MDRIVPKLRRSVKDILIRNMRHCREAGLKSRYLMIGNLVSGRSPPDTADALAVDVSTVYRVARRYREAGEVGLLDRGEENGELKLDEVYLAMLYELV